jgi:flavorubredoxin
MCTLHAPTKLDKQSLSYLLQFLQIDCNGFPCPNAPRSWEKTIENTYDLYNTFVTKNITEVKHLRTVYGVTDSINNKIIEGLRKKTDSVVKKVAQLVKEDITDLFNPFFKLQGILLVLLPNQVSVCLLIFLLLLFRLNRF